YGQAEASREDERVHVALSPVGGTDAARRDPGDGGGDQLDVVAGEGGQGGVGAARPLAAEVVVGGELARQLRVADGGGHEAAVRTLDGADDGPKARAGDDPRGADECVYH